MELSMKFFLLINVKMPTIVGILIFISRKNFMLNWVEYEKSFITSGPSFLLIGDRGLVRVHCIKLLRGPPSCCSFFSSDLSMGSLLYLVFRFSCLLLYNMLLSLTPTACYLRNSFFNKVLIWSVLFCLSTFRSWRIFLDQEKSQN